MAGTETRIEAVLGGGVVLLFVGVGMCGGGGESERQAFVAYVGAACVGGWRAVGCAVAFRGVVDASLRCVSIHIPVVVIHEVGISTSVGLAVWKLRVYSIAGGLVIQTVNYDFPRPSSRFFAPADQVLVPDDASGIDFIDPFIGNTRHFVLSENQRGMNEVSGRVVDNLGIPTYRCAFSIVSGFGAKSTRIDDDRGLVYVDSQLTAPTRSGDVPHDAHDLHIPRAVIITISIAYLPYLGRLIQEVRYPPLVDRKKHPR